MIYDKTSFLPGALDDPEFYQKIFDALPIPIFYRDLQGIYQMCNKAHEDFSGKVKSVAAQLGQNLKKEIMTNYFSKCKKIFVIQRWGCVSDCSGNPFLIKFFQFIKKDCNGKRDPCGNAQKLR